MAGGLPQPQRRLVSWLVQTERTVVSADDVTAFLSCEPKQAKRLCHGLSDRGWLTGLGNERYLIHRPTRSNTPRPVHRLIVGSYLADPYYYSYQTAAGFHGFLPKVSSPVYIVTTNGRSHCTIRNVDYRFVRVLPRKFFGYEAACIQGQEIMMADKEKTMVDCLEKMWYAGGIHHVIRMVREHIDAVDVQKLVEYAVLMHNSTLLQRLGFFLERLGVPFDEELLLSYTRGTLYYLDPYDTFDEKTTLCEKWSLMVNVPASLFR